MATKVKFNITSDDIEQADSSGEFELPPVGFYTAKVAEAKSGYKKVDGVEDKKSPRIEITYQISGVGKEGKDLGGKNYGRLWDYITFSEASGWKRVEFLRAMGLPPQKPGSFEVDLDELVGKTVVVKIKHEKDNRSGSGEMRARIGNTYPFEDADAAAAFGAAAPASDDDSDAYADDDEEETASEEANEDEASDEEFLTEEELREMDTKELGSVAREFDIDPNDFVKKVRGKNKVDTDGLIAAVLEAQGDVDDSDEDESPF